MRWIVHGVLFVAKALSLGSYAQLYRRVLAALGARIRFRLAADVILATFFVIHLTPFGSATGTLVNASALEADGIATATTGEAIALTSLTSTVALIVLFGTGFAATAGRHVSHQYLVNAGVALFLAGCRRHGKARDAAGWLTAFRALISAERGVFPGS